MRIHEWAKEAKDKLQGNHDYFGYDDDNGFLANYPETDSVREKLLDDCIKEFKEIAKCGAVSRDAMRDILTRAAELEGR